MVSVDAEERGMLIRGTRCRAQPHYVTANDIFHFYSCRLPYSGAEARFKLLFTPSVYFSSVSGFRAFRCSVTFSQLDRIRFSQPKFNTVTDWKFLFNGFYSSYPRRRNLCRYANALVTAFFQNFSKLDRQSSSISDFPIISLILIFWLFVKTLPLQTFISF